VQKEVGGEAWQDVGGRWVGRKKGGR